LTARASRLVLALFAAVLAAAEARADVPNPTVDGPVTGGLGAPFVAATTFKLGKVGYEQAEYFLSGTASAFTNVGPLGADGAWTVAPGTTAPYETRIVVYRPKSAKRFDGTVLVEWLNVSGGVDAAPDWIGAHTELIREGVAWVGVTAQRAGIEGGGGLLGLGIDLGLKKVDPVRYAALHHPGDSFSYDIFSQAAQAIRSPSGTSPLGKLRPKRVIAVGESQSAFRLAVYIDAIHPLTHLFDGFFVHSRGGVPLANLSEAPEPAVRVPNAFAIRSDIDVPVLDFQTETDLTILGSLATRQDDTDRFRLWEVAGTAHADSYILGVGMTDLGRSPAAADLVLTTMPVPQVPSIVCPSDVNSGPQHFVLDAAFAALIRWVRTGTPPASAPRLDVAAGAIVRDAHGNASGGVRSPAADVPIATFTGEQDGASVACLIFGTTTPFDAGTLHALYPTHGAFVSAWNQATKDALRAGHLVAQDAKLLRRWAAKAAIPQ
jgi:hypothetical protein